MVNASEDQPDEEFKNFKKSFTIIIYDCNDSSQYYKTTIMFISYASNLALVLASVANYDHNWCHKLEYHLLTMLEASFTIKMCL